MAGDPGDGVLVQPFADHLRLRRRPEAPLRCPGRTQEQRHPRRGSRHDGADGDVLLLQLRVGPVAGRPGRGQGAEHLDPVVPGQPLPDPGDRLCRAADRAGGDHQILPRPLHRRQRGFPGADREKPAQPWPEPVVALAGALHRAVHGPDLLGRGHLQSEHPRHDRNPGRAGDRLPAVPDADVRDPAGAIAAPVFGPAVEPVRGADRPDRTVSDHLFVHALKRVAKEKRTFWSVFFRPRVYWPAVFPACPLLCKS
ncbi:hypothetical protein EMIT051CA3_10254 [Pseudomonas chlororaphis]